MTVQDAVMEYASVVHKLALQLHLLGRPEPFASRDKEEPMQKIKTLITRYAALRAMQHSAASNNAKACSMTFGDKGWLCGC
jgi:hypothetical protein